MKSHSGQFIYRQSARASHLSHSFSVKARAIVAAGRYCFENWAPSGREKSRTTRSPAPRRAPGGRNKCLMVWPSCICKELAKFRTPLSRTHSLTHENTMPLLSYYYFISKSINRSLNRHSSVASAPNTGWAASSLDSAAAASDSRRQSGPRSPCTHQHFAAPESRKLRPKEGW
jgi:hypothetical protein